MAENGTFDPLTSGEDYGEAAVVILGGQSLCEPHFLVARQAIIDRTEAQLAARRAIEKAQEAADDG
jgi:hypothetical protein